MSNRQSANDEPPETQRIEAFSDGVFAIAITLLVLDIKAPHVAELLPGQNLHTALISLWPSYFAWIVSAIAIGIYWANHHYVFKMYKRTDHVFNLLNVFFLMCISFVPLPTAVLGENLATTRDRQTAVEFYILGLFLPALSWYLSWLYASKNGLIDPSLEPAFVAKLSAQYLVSLVLYLAAYFVSDLNANVGIGIAVLLTAAYLMPPRKPVYRS